MGRRVLLGCGVAASVLYVVMNVLGALAWPRYSLTAHSISELAAIDAPSRPLWNALGAVYDVLLLLFGVGVWRSAGGSRALRVAGALVIGLGLFGVTAPFTAMHQRAVLAAGGGTLSDTLHLVAAGIGSLLFLLIIGFGAAGLSRGFRRYSAATLLVMLGLGWLAARDAPRVQADLPTPWLGVTERGMFLSVLLWFAVFALALWRHPAPHPRLPAAHPGGHRPAPKPA